MPDYEKMYFRLRSAITEALDQLYDMESQCAVDILQKALEEDAEAATRSDR